MNHRRPKYLNFLPGRAVIVTLLMMIVVAVAPASLRSLRVNLAWLQTTVLAQDDSLDALNDVYAKLESEGLKENYIRLLSYTMLQEYLPPGARFTSGYRSPQQQLNLILRMARARGIPTQPNATVDDENSWAGALAGLRSRGVMINAPKTTPHGSDEAVFDLAGADLDAIQKGLNRAKESGWVFNQILVERQNNAVHVSVKSLSPKALIALGKYKSSQGATPTNQGTGTPPSPPESDQRLITLQQLQSRHDSEPDPAKKIDYDRSRKNILDPAADSEKIRALDEEIKLHQQEARQLAGESLVREAVARVSEALRDDRYEDAEREAQSFAKKYPKLRQAQSMLKQVRMRRLISEAQDALYASDKPGCSECQKADELINEALKLYPNHEGALSIKDEVTACLEPCTSKTVIVVVILGILTFVLAASGIGFFFLSRSGASPVTEGFKAPAWITEKVRGSHGWMLEGIEGAGKGQTFALNKEKIVVGSQGPPDGTADIVICDAQRKISRQHCLIMHNGKQFYLLDESTNGTKINGHELQRGVVAEFRSGDQITLADVAVLLLRPQ